MSITLYGFPKEPNAPSASGYCQKLETFLRATGFTSYTHMETFPQRAPKGKLPYVVLERKGRNPETIADSHIIIRHLIEEGLARDPDEHLAPAQRADARAWIAWTEETYAAIVHTRWLRPANYEANVALLPAPWPIRRLIGWYLKRNLGQAMYAQGVGRHSDAEIDVFMQEWVDGVDARLGASDAQFFFGEQPSMADITVYGFLANTLSLTGNAEVSKMILSKGRLRSYVATLTQKWFPEYEELFKVVRPA